MKSGKMRDAVILKRYSKGKNADHTPKKVLEDELKIRANVIYSRGKQYFDGYLEGEILEGRGFTRSMRNIKVFTGIEIAGIDYEIVSIRPVNNKNAEVEIVFKVLD